ncbi:MAG: hypothetical protein QM779_04150 [Propionicimonas sp.]|uniref:hypothetical protein n=1 Tax=Propionicimonas sp. TaxID=1955623 RepID=UPI003D0B06FF
MIETVMEQRAPAMARLEAAIAAETAAQAAKARAILDLALERDWRDSDEFEMVGERPVRIGGEGTPLVDEALPLEIAALSATSVTSATLLVRDVVNLHGRLPSVWRAVEDGRVPFWRARQLTQLADTFGLGYGECLRVDALVEPALGLLGWGRVLTRFRAAIIEVAPARVTAHTERSRRSRHVHTGVSADDPSLAWMSALADAADVKAFEHLLGLVTTALVDLGDTDPVDVVRSRALGRLADPEGVLALLDGVDDSTPAAERVEKPSRRRHAPVAQVYVHVGSDVLEEGGAARIEKIGPVLVDELSNLVGHHRIRLTPVVYVHDVERAVDAYEVPEGMRESVLGRDRYEVFPFSTRAARGCDQDHTIPFAAGATGQTRPSNLGPLTRGVHRGKTHAGWKLEQPRPGVFRWTSPRGQQYLVGPDGTRNVTPTGPAPP